MKKLLVIGKTFPEPSTTAAGGRMMCLLAFFQSHSYDITFASSAKSSDYSADLESLGITQESIQVNDSAFDTLIATLAPNIVVYDRYHTEEQFGWRIREQAPNALTILDTEDLHFLRKARQDAFKQQLAFETKHLFTEDAKRELASIWRCDLTLVISEFEMELLENTFKVPSQKLFYLPLTVSQEQIDNIPPTDSNDKVDFISAGNFYHKPNEDAVLFLKQEIWPLIRKELPQAKLHIYGAYAPQRITEMHKPSEGFHILGWTEDLNAAYQNAKVCIAPLRFGAGLKGKLIQAMLCATSVVTTKMGAEGMYGKHATPGIIANSAEEIAKAAIQLYKDTQTDYIGDIKAILEDRFLEDQFHASLIKEIENLQANLVEHRQTHFIGEILHHQSLQSTKYLSKWIEEKNKD